MNEQDGWLDQRVSIPPYLESTFSKAADKKRLDFSKADRQYEEDVANLFNNAWDQHRAKKREYWDLAIRRGLELGGDTPFALCCFYDKHSRTLWKESWDTASDLPLLIQQFTPDGRLYKIEGKSGLFVQLPLKKLEAYSTSCVTFAIDMIDKRIVAYEQLPSNVANAILDALQDASYA